MHPAIEIINLNKQFTQRIGWWGKQQTKTAVHPINLSIPKGELFGLLGPNGAGKTTFVKMLATLILPTSGTATIAGHSLDEDQLIRQKVGLVVADERSFYWRLTGRNNLLFFAAMYRLHGTIAQKRVAELLDAVQLSPVADQPFGTYSTGMKQRLAMARALLHHPEILFLDEPSRSLDPTATQQLHELIATLRQNMTIFLITHDLNEAEKLCDRVAVMFQGKIQVTGSPSELRQQLYQQQQYLLHTSPISPLIRTQLNKLTVTSTYTENQLTVQIPHEGTSLTAVLDLLRTHQIDIYQIYSQIPSLEEVFTHFTRVDK